MDTLSNYRKRALASLEHGWGTFVCATLVYLVISSICQSFTRIDEESASLAGLSLVMTILLLPLMWGFYTMYLDHIRGEKVGLGNLFQGYSKEWFSKSLLTLLLMYVYILLWTLLLIIPGIIKALSYAMTPYVLKDNPNMKSNEAIEESMRLMSGHKAELFLLSLSFIGWALLSLLTLGIGFLWLIPYMQTACAYFYEDLKKEAGERQ
jgi:integral membrane protein